MSQGSPVSTATLFMIRTLESFVLIWVISSRKRRLYENNFQELIRRSSLPLAKLTDEVTTVNEGCMDSCGSAVESIIGVVHRLHINFCTTTYTVQGMVECYVAGEIHSMD